jgi:anti-sigma regulatory factor (Ser/Thr protein kinase)/biotin operon repressor
MTRIRPRGQSVREFILGHVEAHASDIAKITSAKFGITRQATNKHLQKLVEEGCLAESGATRARIYRLASISEWRHNYPATPELKEDVVWSNAVRTALGHLPDNVMNIWQTVFTEMFNNAIDHSGGSQFFVGVTRTANYTEMYIADDGVGIFKKIQNALGLLDERHAVLELSKGKFTTDPANHTGEGIFFASRMVDSFGILSGGVYFSHDFGQPVDWILEQERFESGTSVHMRLSNHTARTTRTVYDQFASGDDFGFNKTVVPVRLAQYGDDKLVSRSQAKRMLARVELFKVVIFDFKGVDTVGQAFADEIFRVFATQHPEIELIAVNAESSVKMMIKRAKG